MVLQNIDTEVGLLHPHEQDKCCIILRPCNMVCWLCPFLMVLVGVVCSYCYPGPSFGYCKGISLGSNLHISVAQGCIHNSNPLDWKLFLVIINKGFRAVWYFHIKYVCYPRRQCTEGNFIGQGSGPQLISTPQHLKHFINHTQVSASIKLTLGIVTNFLLASGCTGNRLSGS